MWDRDEQASPPRLVHSIFLNWAILLAMRVLTDWFDSVVSCEISKSYLHSLHCCVFFPLSWDTVSESVHSSLKDVLRKWGHLGFPSKQFHSSGNPLLLYEPPPTNNKVWLSYFHYPFPHHQDVLREVGVGKRWNERRVTLANREYFI